MSSAGRNSISSCFQHGLQDGYLSLKPHVKGGLFPLMCNRQTSGAIELKLPDFVDETIAHNLGGMAQN